MSARRAGSRFVLTLSACALLAACATPPPRPSPQPATVIARPTPPPPTLAPLAPVAVQGDLWANLTASFAMDDCSDSPLVRAREAMFTRSPARFEQLLRQSLPLMMYVNKELQAAGIPGEFAMLPMLESSYDPREPSRRGDPAGMWQLMPRTARLHGIVIDRHYDGRLDPVASTRVAIKMLTAFGEQFGDWRLADMAYNAGPYAVLGALRGDPDLGDSGIPDIPLNQTARNHLAKLMALACILREPERFRVELPKPSADDELAAVTVPAGTRFDALAGMAEISGSALRALNPGYLGASVPSDSPRTLLLPVEAARSLTAALAIDTSETVAQVNAREHTASPAGSLPLPAEPAPPLAGPDDGPAQATAAHARRHRVRKGETLWSIAQRYHVNVDDLKRWNDLHGSTVRAGDLLHIQG